MPSSATPMLASAVVVGVLAGLATGGRLAALEGLRLAWWPLLAAAVVLRLSAGAFGDVAPAVYVVAFAAIAAVALANRHLAGAALVALGAALNLTVVALNGGMPVSLDAVAFATAAFPHDSLHVELVANSRLPYLADVIPIALVRSVYSAGDIFLALGGAWVSFAAVRRT